MVPHTPPQTARLLALFTSFTVHRRLCHQLAAHTASHHTACLLPSSRAYQPAPGHKAPACHLLLPRTAHPLPPSRACRRALLLTARQPSLSRPARRVALSTALRPRPCRPPPLPPHGVPAAAAPHGPPAGAPFLPHHVPQALAHPGAAFLPPLPPDVAAVAPLIAGPPAAAQQPGSAVHAAHPAVAQPTAAGQEDLPEHPVTVRRLNFYSS